MVSDKTFDAAYAFKETKIWKKISPDEIFGLKFSDGETGFIVINSDEDSVGINVYPGDSAFNEVRRMLEPTEENESIFAMREHFFRQYAIMANFTKAEYLPPEAVERAREYAKDRGIKFSGKFAFPGIVKVSPYRVVGTALSEKEEDYLCEAMDFMVSLSDELKSKKMADYGVNNFFPDIPFITRFEKDGDMFKAMKYELPVLVKERYPRPAEIDDITVAGIKKGEYEDWIECEVVYHNLPLEAEPGQPPFFSAGLLAVTSADNYAVGTDVVRDYYEDYDSLLRSFATSLRDESLTPEGFYVRDRRTFDFLEDFAKKLGVKIEIRADLVNLEEMEKEFFDMNAFYSGLDEDEVEELYDEDSGEGEEALGGINGREHIEGLISMLEELTPEAINEMPAEIRGMVEFLADSDEVDSELKERINKALGRE